MLNRKLALVACVWLAISLAAFGQANLGNSYLFQLPGAAVPGSRILGYLYNGNPFNPTFDVQRSEERRVGKECRL